MADTQLTKAQILSIFADNVTGQISAQDLRNYVVTLMESEFLNPGDFWAKPQAKYSLTDKTARGFKMYSQYIGSDVSWMNILFQDPSTGYWLRADAADSTKNGGLLGMAMDSYTSEVSTAVILIEGLVYDSSFSTVFSRRIGRPIYLDSGVPGSVSVGEPTSSQVVVGYVTGSDNFGGSAIGKWYFKPETWSVKGA
jgi:hypothetical protein